MPLRVVLYEREHLLPVWVYGRLNELLAGVQFLASVDAERVFVHSVDTGLIYLYSSCPTHLLLDFVCCWSKLNSLCSIMWCSSAKRMHQSNGASEKVKTDLGIPFQPNLLTTTANLASSPRRIRIFADRGQDGRFLPLEAGRHRTTGRTSWE